MATISPDSPEAGIGHGAYRHGLFTAEAIEDRCALRSLIRESRELIAMLPEGDVATISPDSPEAGSGHGAYRHGLFTAEAIEDRCALRSLIRESRELIAMLPGEGEQ